LPKKLTQLRCLEKEADKFSLLRDICLAVGITVYFGPRLGDERELVLENDGKKMRERISAIINRQKQSANSKKKKPSV
jgi:hypothetical protein